MLVLDTGIGVTFLEILVGRMLAMPSSIHPEVGVVRQQAWTEARVRLVGGREPVVEGNYEVAPTRGCCTLESLHGGFYVAPVLQAVKQPVGHHQVKRAVRKGEVPDVALPPIDCVGLRERPSAISDRLGRELDGCYGGTACRKQRSVLPFTGSRV